MIKRSILCFLVLLQFVIAFPQSRLLNSDQWLKAIRTDDEKTLLSLIVKQPNAVNGFTDGKRFINLLIYSIEKGKEKVVGTLLEHGANPNAKGQDTYPLIIAVRRMQYASVKALLLAGADANVTDDDGNTPLAISTRSGSLRITKMLVEAGATLLKPDRKGRLFSDKVSRFDAPQLSSYLENMENRQRKLKTLPNWSDGPYVITDSSKVIAFSMRSDSSLGTAIKTYHKLEGDYLIVNGKKSQFLSKKYATIPKSVKLAGYEKTVVVGDVHGQYQNLTHLLKKADVINDSLNWKFGNNCLVFVGDILDRGEQVTECLWLIHRLGLEAEKVGGKVIYLMGNHEELILLGDNGYVNDKYCALLNYFGLKAADVFAPETFFGDWLRKLPVAVVIGKTLITHAGISREMDQMNMSIGQIDSTLYSFFNSPPHQPNPLESLILMDEGPLWTRQYFPELSSKEPLDSKSIKSILKKLNVETMIIGHTEVPTINTMFDNLVIGVNVPFNSSLNSGELLLIENDSKFYKIKFNGDKELFFIRN